MFTASQEMIVYVFKKLISLYQSINLIYPKSLSMVVTFSLTKVYKNIHGKRGFCDRVSNQKENSYLSVVNPAITAHISLNWGKDKNDSSCVYKVE